MFLERREENGGRIMITCDFVFVVVDGKKGTAGLGKVRFSNRSFTVMSDRQARL